MPSYAPAFGTVSRCEPISRRGASACAAGISPRRFPAASTRTSAPSDFIQPAISRWQSRMGGDKNVRRVLPASSVNEASFWQRAMTSAARLVVSVVRTRFQYRCNKCSPHAGSGLAYKFRRHPAKKNEADKDLPTVCVPVGRDRKVIADHDKDNRNRHERIVFGTQLRLSAK